MYFSQKKYFIEYCKRISPEMYPTILKKIYKIKTNKELNLNNPKTFNEKIQWLKLYDTTQEKTDWTDKITAYYLFKQIFGDEFLKKIYGIYNCFDEINFDALPETFCLKANHGCGMNFFCTSKTDLLSSPQLYNELKKQTVTWLNTNFAYAEGFELQYKDIKPKLFIEELILPTNGKLREYSFFCFNGSPLYIQAKITENSNLKTSYPLGFYDIYWQKCNFSTVAISNTTVPPPLNYQRMLEISKKLCKNFKFVRIDFIEKNEKLYFLETTFTPYSGFYQFKPEKYDRILGGKLIL